MSATTSSLKHSSVYRFTQTDHSSSSSSYSPLRRLQHLTTMVSQPNLVLPVRDPERSWEWGAQGKGKGKMERDSWVDYKDYSVSQITNGEENFAHSPFGQKQPEVQNGGRNTPPASCTSSVISEKKAEGCFSGPPSPAFSLDSNSPFANGLLHFESTLFEGEDNDEERETISPIGGILDHQDKTEPQSPPRNINMASKDTVLPSAKVVTRSQSSGQRRRYWDGSEDEWDSDTELFLFEDSPFLHSVGISSNHWANGAVHPEQATSSSQSHKEANKTDNLMQNSPKRKPLPPVKFVEGEVVWAKFNRRPWWPCEVIVDSSQGVYHRVKEPSDRLCRLYYVRTFGEPKELFWVEEKSTHTFHGGFEFEQLHLLRRRGKQREQNKKYTIAKRFQDSWKSSVAEAESVLPGRPKMAPSMCSSTNTAFTCSSPQERETRTHPTFPPLSSSVSTLPETLHITNGFTLSPNTTPTKPSTLKKSSGKKKQSKSLKGTNSKHSKKTLQCSPDQSGRDSGECPYSDLDSVPKILCPKALERQPKLVPSQPSVAVVKELKKQPEIQSGLWFSKSGKERRPKTTNPVPDRSLFSKVPCKKKTVSTSSKKTLVSPASSFGGAFSDQATLPEKQKTTDNHLLLEQSEPIKQKNTKSSTKPVDTVGSSVDQSGYLDNQMALLSVESPKVTQTNNNSADNVVNPSSGLLSISDVKMDSVPSKKVQFHDQSSVLKSGNSVSRTKSSATMATKQVSKTDKTSDQEKELDKTSASCLKAETNDSESRLENHTSLVSRCRLPFVKLIRKEIKDNYLNSGVRVRLTDQIKRTKKEKTSEANGIEAFPCQSARNDSKSSSCMEQTVHAGPMKVAVKKLKASNGSDVLRLSDSLHDDTMVASDKSADDLAGPVAERISVLIASPKIVIQSLFSQSEGNKTPLLDQTNKSDQSDSLDQSIALVTASSTTPQPSKHIEDPVCQNSVVPEGPSEEPTKVVHDSKQVSEVNQALNKQPAHLPASNGLMTRALKAMHEVDQKKREKILQEVEQKQLPNSSRKVEDLEWKSDVGLDVCTNLKIFKSQHVVNVEHDQDAVSFCSSPSLTFSDSNDFEANVKSEDEDHSVSSTPTMDFIPLTSKEKAKHEGQSSSIQSSSSPPSPFSFMKDFKNVEEVSFQSLTNDSDGKPISFKTDKKYKFSTFLMMLKDLHDTREREGAPLELDIGPPSAHVKEEPLVLPQEAPSTGQGQNLEFVLSNIDLSPNKSVVPQNEFSAYQKPKRSYNKKGSHWLKRKNNRRTPHSIRSGPGFPGLESSFQKKYLSAMKTSLKVDFSSRILGIPGSSWQSQTEGGEEEVLREEERWTSFKGNHQILVPLVQESDTTLLLEQENDLVADYTKTNTGLVLQIGHESKASREHKRKRKPSKRLIEWSEVYNQNFPARKKTKKPLQLIGKATEHVTSMSEVPGSDQNDQDHAASTILPEILTPPPEEFVLTTPPELQIPKAELPSSQDPPMLSMNTLTPPPEADSPAESLVTDNKGAAVFEKKRKRKPTQKILEYCLEAEASTVPKKKMRGLKTNSSSAAVSDSAPSSCKSKCKPLSPASDITTCTPAPSCQTAPPPSTSAPVPAEPSQVETADSPEPEEGYLQEDAKEADESEVELSGLDHRFSSVKDDLLLCDDSVLPVRKIIGDRGGPASMKENVCQVCEKTGELLLCEGQCCGAFHLPCISLAEAPKGKFVCPECKSGVHTCFVCKKRSEDVRRCMIPVCGKFYHGECIANYAPTAPVNRGFRCSIHVCLTCFIASPNSSSISKGRLVRCVRCPVAYHATDLCMAAGCVVLSNNSIICPNHFTPRRGVKNHEIG
ncbi:uncharacterized protein LOC119420823, partial [Nematolebias whitei]|uniref:uncharacterized protein LOC119420823 n=1 Tax=Nematolebias whitei TaxID=451745 RepID=UPI00189AC113